MCSQAPVGRSSAAAGSGIAAFETVSIWRAEFLGLFAANVDAQPPIVMVERTSVAAVKCTCPDYGERLATNP
jgi:hypothetical protein